MKSLISCKLCGKNGAAAKSHVVPNAFYEPALRASGGRASTQISSDGKKRIVQSGVYDTSLLCEDCEKTHSHYDRDLADVFRDSKCVIERVPDSRNHQNLVFIGERWHGIDIPKLRNAILFLVWRVLASERAEFPIANEDRVKHQISWIIRNNYWWSNNKFGIAIYKYHDFVVHKDKDNVETAISPDKLWINPAFTSLGRDRVLEIPLGRCGVWISFEQKRHESFWRSIAIPAANGVINVVLRSFCGSKEFEFIRDLAKKATTASGAPSPRTQSSRHR